jgi:hypothetical protein
MKSRNNEIIPTFLVQGPEEAEQAAKAAAKLAAVKQKLTEEERKLAQNAPYAALKNRQ